MTPAERLRPRPGAGRAPAAAGGADRRAGARRADILGVIRASRGGLGVRALAEATGLHENTVRFHLDRLLEDGLVERRTGVSRGPGRPPLTFVARRDHHGAGHDNYELLARVLAGQLGEADDPFALAEAAGRSWARGRLAGHPAGAAPVPPGAVRVPPGAEAVAQVGARDPQDGAADPWDAALGELAQVLEEAGFAPEVEAGAGSGATVRVHHCPFLRLAREDREVPCAVHLGLMEGVLEATGSGGTVERLEPFVTPSLCVAHVRAPSGR